MIIACFPFPIPECCKDTDCNSSYQWSACPVSVWLHKRSLIFHVKHLGNHLIDCFNKWNGKYSLSIWFLPVMAINGEVRPSSSTQTKGKVKLSESKSCFVSHIMFRDTGLYVLHRCVLYRIFKPLWSLCVWCVCRYFKLLMTFITLHLRVLVV